MLFKLCWRYGSGSARRGVSFPLVLFHSPCPMYHYRRWCGCCCSCASYRMTSASMSCRCGTSVGLRQMPVGVSNKTIGPGSSCGVRSWTVTSGRPSTTLSSKPSTMNASSRPVSNDRTSIRSLIRRSVTRSTVCVLVRLAMPSTCDQYGPSHTNVSTDKADRMPLIPEIAQPSAGDRNFPVPCRS